MTTTLDLAPNDRDAAERLAALLALPVSDEPLTDDERAAFDEGERLLASGEGGPITAEIEALTERAR